MGVDCSIYSLNPKTGEIKSLGLDREWVFGCYRNRDERFPLCTKFVPVSIALLDLSEMFAYQTGPDGQDQKHRDSGYAEHWITEAQVFVHRSEVGNFFAVVDEQGDVESEKDEWGLNSIHDQWPLCPVCEFPSHVPKRADNIKPLDGNPTRYQAECHHMCDGREVSKWEWIPKGIPEWVLNRHLNSVLYG